MEIKKQGYRELNESQLRFILSTIEDALIITGGTGHILYINPAAEELLGTTKDGIRKKRLWEVIPFVEQNDEFMQTFLNTYKTKKRCRHKLLDYENINGRQLKLRVSMSYADYLEGIFVILLSDLTELFRVNSAFSRYTSRQIAEYVLSSEEGERQGGKSRDVTILMSDLRGFTAISASLDAMQLVRLLNHYFEKMVEIIDQFGGSVIEFLGDGIFVVFGAPADDPLHPSHAVHCAVGMQNAMAEVNAWNREEGLPELEMGIGVHTGQSVVGNIGSTQKMKYGCIGETVNLAGRIESLTIGGQVLISASVRDRIGEPLEIRSEQTFMPKGSRSEITALEVTAIGSTALKLSEDPGAPQEIAPPCPRLRFSLLNGKTVGRVIYEGVLTALSEDQRFFWLQTEADLELHRNVLLRIGRGVYAKIISRDKDTYILCFTPKPDNLEELLDGLASEGAEKKSTS